MCRKLFLAAVAVLVALVVIRKTELGTLLQVWWNDARSDWKKQIPPEKRIQMLKVEIAKINDDISRAVTHLATLKTDREELSRSVENLRGKVADRKKTLKAMVEALENGNTYVSAGEELKANELEARMNLVRKDLDTSKSALKFREEHLKLKSEAYQAASDSIRAIQQKKNELETLVVNLEVQVEQLKMKKVENNWVLDTTHVSKAEALYAEIQRDLNVEKNKAELYDEFGLTSKRPTTTEEPAATRQESLKAARAALEEEVAGKK
jgi:chromosome segregation ATPase